MKKTLYIILFLFSSFMLSSCYGRERLLILNWGEYINDEAVALFEEEYKVDVTINLADSNELFYAKIKSGTTAYDLVVPSEYMTEKMIRKDLLQPIDKSRLTNLNKVTFMPGVLGIQAEMEKINPEFNNYQIPYFWGTFGLMYNKLKPGLEEAVNTLGWEAFFNEDKAPAGTRVAMYDVPRFAYAAALLYRKESPNAQSDEALELARTTLSQRVFDEWGDDLLKKNISANNLDLAFVYTGDFLDMLYIKLETTPLDKISFDIYIPNDTIAFMDSLVIPKKARHVDLAYKFIDFFLRPEIAYLNASVVGYCTPIRETYDQIVNYEGDNEWLNAWSYANKTYYPLPLPGEPQYKGVPLKDLDREYLNRINTMVNNIKVKN